MMCSLKLSTTVKGVKAMNVRNSPGASEGESAEAMVTSVTRFVEGEMQRGREKGKRSSTKNTRAVGRSAPFFLFFVITDI